MKELKTPLAILKTTTDQLFWTLILHPILRLQVNAKFLFQNETLSQFPKENIVYALCKFEKPQIVFANYERSEM